MLTYTARLAFPNPNADVVLTFSATSESNALWRAVALRDRMGAWARAGAICDVRRAAA
jgi:hypothetical protein